MHPDLEVITEAAKGLRYISESDHPMEPVQLHSTNVEEALLELSGESNGANIEKQSVDYFFRNMIKTYPQYSPEERKTAQQFSELLELLKQKLEDVEVYRIGTTQVHAFIIGKLENGTYAGLRTKLVET